MTFRSKIDDWLIVVMLLPIAPLLYDAYRQPRIEQLLVVLFLVALWTYLLLSTKYKIDGDELLVQVLFIKKRVHIQGISKIEATRNPISSAALSLDRIRLCYSEGNLFYFLQKIEKPLSKYYVRRILP